jgi:diadenosine tetraphosphate (Ap4A) HIT family hydrolase
VIARYQTDPAWPDTVWDHPNRIPYSLEDKRELQLFLYDQFHSQLH